MSARNVSAEKARRMMALLPLLSRGRDVPLAELAAVVGAAPGVVASDIATLQMCGLPPFTPDSMVDVFLDGDIVRVFGEPPALSRPLRLTPGEAAALAAALEACGRSADDPLVRRLLEAASPTDADSGAASLHAADADADLARIHALLAAATAAHEAVRIEYFSAARDERSVRVIEPWALGFDRGAWYVKAWCRSASDERVFRLDRILSAEPIGETFQPPSDVRPPVPALPDPARLPRATVRFGRTASEDLPSREWPGTLFSSGQADDILAEVPFASTAWLARRVAARLGEAELLSPPELRRAAAELASDVLELLATDDER
jgi:proteasome accessory factor C